MISDMIVENGKEVKKPFRIFKAAYHFALPFLVLFAVVTGVLSLFPSDEGKNAQTVATVLFFVFLFLCVALFTVEKIFENNIPYKMYEHPLTKKVDVGTLLPLIVIALITLIPFYIMAITSLKTQAEANDIGFSWWPKMGLTLNAFERIIVSEGDVGVSIVNSFGNSLLYTLVPTTVGLFVSALSAYGFSKLEFKGKQLMFDILIMTIMLPGCVTMSSSYVLFDMIGWVNSRTISVSLPLLIPGCFGSITTVMFLKEYYAGIPDDLIAAAQIDGAGKMRIFFSFMLPLGQPALMAQFILGFISRFNEFLGPLIYAAGPEQYTLQVTLRFFDTSVPDRANQAAAGMLSLLPVFLLYLCFQKQILNGISMSSGLKG